MNQVISNFCTVLLHSLWQAALLFAVYYVLKQTVLRKAHAIEKRNVLFVFLASQILMSAITFNLVHNSFRVGGHPLSYVEIALSDNWPVLNNLLFGIYLMIVFYKTFVLYRRWRYFSFITDDRVKAPVEMRLFVDVRSREMGIRKKISVWLSDNISSPLTYGWLKPVILLPITLVNNLSQEEAETLILHELAHIASKDYLLNFCVITSEILFFFNPFTRFLISEIKMEREKNCDLNVLHFSYSPLLYAGTLLKTARYSQHLPQLTMAAVSKKSALMERIKLITEEKDFSTNKSGNPGMFAFLVLIVMAVGLFGVSSLKPAERNQVAEAKSSYAPNEVFSFVKEVTMKERAPEHSTELSTAAVTKDIATTSPAREKDVPAPARKKVQEPAYVKADERTILTANYFTIPVTNKELIEKEIEITEEDPQTGVITTTGIKMTWTDSGWVARPLWQTKLNTADTATAVESSGTGRPVPFYEAQ